MPRPVFPKTLTEFQQRFADEASCRGYLTVSRWPEGYGCPRCSHTHAFELPRRRLWECKACRYQTSVTAGTVRQATHTSLTNWFWAAYLVATLTPGISARQLTRQLGLGSYRTAWVMLHKLRRGMVNSQREPLHGKVEVDEVDIGGPQEGLRGGRELGSKALVVGARRGQG